MNTRTPTLIIGGTGYVAGELLRLVGQHPGLELAGVSSESQAGTAVSAAFPHLAPVVRDLPFITQAELIDEVGHHASGVGLCRQGLAERIIEEDAFCTHLGDAGNRTHLDQGIRWRPHRSDGGLDGWCRCAADQQQIGDRRHAGAFL